MSGVQKDSPVIAQIYSYIYYMQIPWYIKSYAATTSTDLPQNANSEHYKQKQSKSVRRPQHGPSPVCVCVCDW